MTKALQPASGRPMTEVMPFDFEGNTVRCLHRAGESWFVLADACRALEIGNSRMAADRLDDDERVKFDLGNGVTIADGAKINDLGDGVGNNEAWIINESGLWSLVLTSRKPAAKRFKKWITSEVIPALRKTGSYRMPGAEPAVTPLDLDAVKAWVGLAEKVKGLAGAEAARSVLVRSPILAGSGQGGTDRSPQAENAPYPPSADQPIPVTERERVAIVRRVSNDEVDRFLLECTVSAPGQRVASQTLWDAYQAWCSRNDIMMKTRISLGRALCQRLKNTKCSNRYYLHIRMKS